MNSSIKILIGLILIVFVIILIASKFDIVLAIVALGLVLIISLMYCSISNIFH